MQASRSERTRLVGELIGGGRSARLRPLFGEQDELPLADAETLGDAPAGSILEAHGHAGRLRRPRLLARPNTALAKMYAIAARHQLDPVFPEAVEREVAEWVNHPALDDPTLRDLRGLPFVSIDGAHTRDLDQAMYVGEEDGALTVYYALADAAWCVQPGSALFAEALRRGATYYLPGLAIPMLPRALSEGLLSLNEHVDRRALVFRMTLDDAGQCSHTELIRGRIHSRGKLSFEQVERHLENPAAEPMSAEVARSLELFRRVGELRLADAERRDVIRYRRTESEVHLDGVEGLRFVIVGGMRTAVERYNEQLSLLCNVEGARFLHNNADDYDQVQPIYRVHPSPDNRRYAEFEELLAAICRRHQLDPRRWSWRRGGKRSLATFLEGLPREGAEGRLSCAIHRQAVMANVRSSFSAEPAGHHGVGAEVYARFSAPMREIVGVFLHKEALEKLQERGYGSTPHDEDLREQIVQRSNQAKALQKQITNEANELVLDQLFQDDLRLPLAQRPARSGTVMGISPGKTHVLLDCPNVEVKLYLNHQQQILNEKVAVSRDGVQLHCGAGRPLCLLGDLVHVRLRDRDKQAKRWVLELVAPESS